MKFAFLYSDIAYGRHRPPLDFDDLDGNPSGMTGTDLIATKFAFEMAKRGHEVDLFVDRAKSNRIDGVNVFPFADWTGDRPLSARPYDVVISASNPNCLEHVPASALRVVNRQVAAFGSCDCTPSWQSFVDLVLCPSRTAVSRVRVDGPAFDVLGNGVDLWSFTRRPKVPGRCVYISSPDRGLHWLLQAWPAIRKAAPWATLRCMYYSLGDWLKNNAADRHYHNPIDAEIGRRAQYVEMGLRKLAGHGVEVHEGGVSHRALADELSAAECLLYPMDPVSFTETFGVAVLEASAAGCLPILSTGDAFGELWSHACPSVDAPVGQRLGEWTSLAVKAMTDASWRDARAEEAKANAAQYAWPVVAEKLERLCEEHIERKRAKSRIHVEIQQPEPRGTIDMVLTPYASGDWPINPYDPWEASKGGGCRTGFMLLARGMASLGWTVRAYSTWANHDKVAGVEHRPLQALGRDKSDALLAYYYTAPLAQLRSPLKIASHHTYLPPNPGTIAISDINVAPSRHAVNALRETYGGRGWGVLPNIVPADIADVERATVAGRVLYHTSADRGLHLLAKCWPEIRAAVPHATLHVVGVTDEWLEVACTDRGDIGVRLRELREAMPAAKAAGGVKLLGRLTRGGVLRELSQAACFAFPCDTGGNQPVETWSTSVVECMAAGVPVVLAPQDALGEMWGGAVMTVGPASESMESFKVGVASVLTNPWVANEIASRQQKRVAEYTAQHAAQILDGMIREHEAGKARAA